MLDENLVKTYRSVTARCNYLAADRPDIKFATRRCAKGMANPSLLDWRRLKRIGRYLKGKPRLKIHYDWQDYPQSASACTRACWVQSDSDWAGDRATRKSTSGGTIRLGGHLIKSWSKDQTVIATSSGEAELYAANHGAQQGLGVRSLARDLGIDLGSFVALEVDASAACGMITRQGLGKVRHIAVNELWLQGAVRGKRVHLRKIGTAENTADLGTKPLGAEVIEMHVAALRCDFVDV